MNAADLWVAVVVVVAESIGFAMTTLLVVFFNFTLSLVLKASPPYELYSATTLLICMKWGYLPLLILICLLEKKWYM